jgi:hypothetical protein
MQESSRISLILDLDDRLRLGLVHTSLPRDSAANTLLGANRNSKLKVLPKVIGGGEGISLASCCVRFYCLQTQHLVVDPLGAKLHITCQDVNFLKSLDMRRIYETELFSILSRKPKHIRRGAKLPFVPNGMYSTCHMWGLGTKCWPKTHTCSPLYML